MLVQDYSAYSENDQAVWRQLFARQMELLPTRASQVYLAGIEAAGFTPTHIPNFEQEINPKLKNLTGWEVVPVAGLIPNQEFFTLLADKKFPASTWLRKPEELDYLEEPDMFHDTFGHVPVLTNEAFCQFLAELSAITLPHIDNPTIMEMVRRLYWYTVEFGLIQEEGQLKIYGGGILSSSGETEYSLESDIPERVPYDIDHILETAVKIDEYQKKYFVISSYEELYQSLPLFAERLKQVASSNETVEANT